MDYEIILDFLHMLLALALRVLKTLCFVSSQGIIDLACEDKKLWRLYDVGYENQSAFTFG